MSSEVARRSAGNPDRDGGRPAGDPLAKHSNPARGRLQADPPQGSPRSALGVAVGALGITAVALLDFVTGYQLSFSLFYLAPILLGVWLGASWMCDALAGGVADPGGRSAARV